MNHLTPREREILDMHCVEAETMKGIAARLYISRPTVKNHLYKARLKLGARSSEQACLFLGIERGLGVIAMRAESV